MNQNSNCYKRVSSQQERSDQPTYTFRTKKAFVFYISSAVTIISMFFNWLPLDLDLTYVQLEDILGNVTVFSLPGALSKLSDALGVLGAFLPSDVTNALSTARLISVVLMVLAIASIAMYIYAAVLRWQEKDKTVRMGRIAALLAGLTVAGFAILVSSAVSALGISEITGNILGVVFTGPALLTLAGAVVSCYCAIMDMEFEEDVVIYHDGRIKIVRWRCKGCGRKNFTLLDKCYYCGTDKNK